MSEPIIIRSVKQPANGHYPTLREARKAASSFVSTYVLFDPARGYKLASSPLPGYDVITRKSAGRKWTRRSDNVVARLKAVRNG